MNLRAITITLLLFSHVPAFANPRILFRANKVWENCKVTIRPTHADIDCRIGYRIPLEGIETWPTSLLVEVPVFLLKNDKRNSESILEDLTASLRIEGQVYTPRVIETAIDIKAPPGLKAIAVRFYIEPSKTGAFELRAIYRQPLISGVFHYHPAFEDDGPSERSDRFVIEVITDGTGSLKLISDHGGGEERSDGKIKIQIIDAEQISIKRNGS